MSKKNTYYLILFLSVLAALVVGLNIGKKMEQQPMSNQPSAINPDSIGVSLQTSTTPSSPTSSLTDVSSRLSSSSSTQKSASSSGALLKNGIYTSASCQVSFSVPDTISVEESTTDAKGAVFTSKTNPTDMVVLTCQKDIPKPPLAPQNIENFVIGTVAGKLYHDSSAKDGTKVDALIFTHPKTKLDVFLGGYGTTFNTLIQSLKIL